MVVRISSEDPLKNEETEEGHHTTQILGGVITITFLLRQIGNDRTRLNILLNLELVDLTEMIEICILPTLNLRENVR